MAIDKIIDRAATIVIPTVGSTEVSDDSNTSTGALDIPAGTTAERPSSPTSGMIRYNTDTLSTEIYDGTAWGKVSPLTPTLNSISETVYTTFAKNLALAGLNFLSSNLVVGFTPSGGSETTVTVTPTSDTAATVAIPSAIYNQSGGTSISVTVTNSDNRTSGAQSFSVTGIPTGGDHVFDQGSDRVHIFKSNANFVVPSGLTLTNVEYLIIAGGGGGSNNGGGGGSGGLRSSVVGDQSGFSNGAAGPTSAESRFSSMTASTYPVVVGTGGTGGSSNANGNNSSFNTIVSTGGGRGGQLHSHNGGAGGSGGGGSGYNFTTGGNGTDGQGGGGGGGYPGQANGYAGGGGGGAAANGNGATSSGGGVGGVGLISTIITSANATTYGVGDVDSGNVYFAGGGNGRGAGTVPLGSATGPLGGGGGADTVAGSQVGNGGVDYTGGGGGCADGDGGDGVVIVRYVLP